MEDYKKLLKRGLKRIPESCEDGGRFSVPVPQVMISGARTIITNFVEIAGCLRREPDHLLKFFLKELATKGNIEGQKLTVLGNFSQEHIRKKLDIYVKQFVICPDCSKPDTKLVHEKTGTFMVCEACGAKVPITR